MTWRRWVLVGVAVAVVWGLASGLSLYQGARQLQEARDSLSRAATVLKASDLSEAREHLAAGRDAAGGAATRLGRWWVAPLRLVPVAGNNLDAARVMAQAAHDLAAPAGELLDVADEIVHTEEQGAGRGQIPLDYVERLQAPLGLLFTAAEDGVEHVEALDCEELLSPVTRACQRFLEVAGPAVDQVRSGSAIAEVAPALLGRGTPRRYLVFAASYSELRGSGGLLGSWAVMTADDGRLDVGEFRETTELPRPLVSVDGPSSTFERRYGRYAALRDWRNTNMSPHLPEVGAALLELWDDGGGEPVDGIVITSPLVVERMIDHLGPLEVPDVTTLTSGNVRDFIGLYAYAAFDSQAERKDVLGEVAAAAFERMLDVVESNDVMASVEVLQQLVVDGDVQMYVRDEATQQVLEQVGIGGQQPEGDGEFASVVVNNVAGNKVDYFTTRRIEHTVRLLTDQTTAAEVAVEFRNEAPTTGFPKYVLGPATPLVEAGDNLSLVSFYCGQGCTMKGRAEGVRDGGTEAGLPVWDVVLRIPSGEARRVAYRTETPGGWRREGEQIVVPVHHVVQPSLHETPLVVRVRVPTGWAPVQLPDGAKLVGDDVVVSGRGVHVVDLELRFAPTEDHNM